MKSKGIYVLNVTILALFCWVMVAFYNSSVEFKSTLNGGGFEFTLNVLPIILFLIVAVPVAVIWTKKQRSEKKGWKAAILFPAELREKDEREKALTAKACRNTYISMMIATPILAACMTFQPIVSSYFAAYPIIILMLLPMIQVTVFYLSIKRDLR